MLTADTIWDDVRAVRDQGPLVHNITNYVVMNTTANALLALGASPIMAHAVDEVADMVDIAGALVLNIGTLSPAWVDAMVRAQARAGERGVPVVLDPVGAGATAYRTRTARRLLDAGPTAIIRGNASEVSALAAAGGTAAATTRGVDSAAASDTAVDAARRVHHDTGAAVALTGATDFVVGTGGVTRVHVGHPLMARVTGMGCTASALCGALATVTSDPWRAAAHAVAVTGIAGQLAARTAAGPGSLQVGFLDALHGLTADQIAEHLRVTPC